MKTELVKEPDKHSGYVRYGDNDPMMNNSRDIFYYSIEAEQKLKRKFYVAARFSEIFAEHGYPIVGLGNFNDYFFGTPATEIWRASFGVGYRFSDNLGLKAEYSLERGNELGGTTRDNEDFFGTEAVFKF